MFVVRILTRPNLGGPTRQAIALWHALQRLGVRTLLVTGEVGADEVLLSPADHGVPAIAFADAVAAPDRAEGWLVVPGLGRRPRPFGDVAVRRRLAELLSALRPDVVHTHTSKAGWLGRRAAFAAGVPVVAHTFHGLVLRDYFGPLGSWWLRRLERRLGARTRLLFAVSASCRDELVELGVAPPGRIAVVPPAVPLAAPRSRAAARSALGIADDRPRAVFVGRGAAVKRVEDFVAAIVATADWCGDLVGERTLPAPAAVLVRASGRFVVRDSDPDIASKLAAYDALVLPSRREGLPLVALEAFAARVPVVGYDVPGVRDALGEGRGVLVPPSAGPAGLAAALAALASQDPAARKAMLDRAGAAAAASAPDVVAATLQAAYRAALTARG